MCVGMRRRQSGDTDESSANALFLSYAREDASFVSSLAALLVESGYQPRLDQQIRPGEQWRRPIEHWIEKSLAVVAILSKAALKSNECANEWRSAHTLGKRMVPLQLEQLEIPSVFDLNAVQCLTKDPTTAIDDLLGALAVDDAWLQFHRGLTDRATTWDDARRTAQEENRRRYRDRNATDKLDRGSALRTASENVQRPPAPSPRVADVHRQFVNAGLDARRRRRWAVGATAVLVVLGFGSLAAVQRSTANERDMRERLALTQRLADDSEQLSATGEYELANLLAREAFLLDASVGGSAAKAVDEALRVTLSASRRNRDLQLSGDPSAIAAAASKPVVAVALSEGGNRATRQSYVAMTDLASSRAPSRMVVTGVGQARSLAVSADGELLAIGGEGGVELFRSPSTDKEPLSFSEPSGWSITFAPDGSALAAVTEEGSVLVWNNLDTLATPRRFELANDRVRAVAFAPDAAQIAAGTWEGKVVLWDLHAVPSQPLVRSVHRGLVTAIAFTSTGDGIISGGRDELLNLAPIDSSAPVRILETHEGGVNTIAISPDGRTVVSASERTVHVFDLARMASVERFRAHVDQVKSVAFADRGRTLVSAGDDSRVRVWSLDGGPSQGVEPLELRPSQHNQVFGVDLDGGRIVAVGEDGNLHIWASADDAQPATIELRDELFDVDVARDRIAIGGISGVWVGHWPDHASAVTQISTSAVDAIELSPDGRLLLVGTQDGVLELWDLASSPARAVRRLFTGARVQDVAFVPNGDLAALALGAELGDPSRYLRWTNGNDEPAIQEAGDSNDLAASVDGQVVLASAPDGTLMVWRGSEPASILRPERGAGGFFGGAVAVDQQGQYAAVGDAEGRVLLWDLGRERIVGSLPSHDDSVNDVVFDESGDVVASVGNDGVLRVEMPTHKLAELVCDLVWRDLTPEEWAANLATQAQRSVCPMMGG
jgi:WD40 repeat protein